jgi:universal stress protein E
LIATGGDEYSDQAVRVGVLLARHVRAAITIMTVVAHESDRPLADAVLARALTLISSPANGSEAIDVKTKVCVGEVITEITSEAEAANYDLLIIGSQPVHGILERIIGPTSERILSQSSRPVLIVKGETGSFHKALVCSSGVGGYQGPTSSVIRLSPILSGTTITLLHVMSQITASPDSPDGWQLQATADELMEEESPEGRLLEERASMLENSGFKVEAKVRHGLVVDEILEESSAGNYDLVVIGAHSTTGWKRYLLDDVAHQIITRADRPVLVV